MNNLSKVFVVTFAGSFAFGFIDNFILVLVGEGLDATIAVVFGFSSMFSAGIGNAVSDTVGVLGEGLMALGVIKMFGEVSLDGVSKTLTIVAAGAGIFVGCLVGMFPLALMM